MNENLYQMSNEYKISNLDIINIPYSVNMFYIRYKDILGGATASLLI